MKPEQPRNVPQDPILEKLENAMKSQAAARTAGTLPVWVRAALLGAGLTLAAGCAGEKAGQPVARDPATVPAPPTGEPPASVVPPAPEMTVAPSTDATAVPATPGPEGMSAGPGLVPGMPPEPKLTADVGSPEATGMLPPDCGAYGAPPMEAELPGGLGPVNGMAQGLAYGAPPMNGPTISQGTLRFSALPGVPATVPAELRTLSLTFLRNLRFCLTTADRASPLVDGGIMVRLLFSGGQLKMTTVTGSASRDATVNRCIAEAKARLQAVTPATSSPEAKAFTKPVELKLSWTR